MPAAMAASGARSEEHTSELQSRPQLVCRLLLEKKKRGYGRTPHVPRLRDGSRGRERRRGDRAHPQSRVRRWRLLSVRRRRSRPPFFFDDPATTEIYTLSLHDALPI